MSPLEQPSGSSPATPGEFLLCTCQAGAEAALQRLAAEVMSATRPGVWRRGLVTFRLPAASLVGDPPHDLVFARTAIHSLGQVTGANDDSRVAAAAALAAGIAFDNVHVWPREATVDLPLVAIREQLIAARGIDPTISPVAKPGDLVLDCVFDSADRWWIGWHSAAGPASCWPGGIYPAAALPLPEGRVSRAWLKLDEAIALFGIPFEPGQRALELGASPGGACQRLLEAGLKVVGVDPAVVDARLAAEPNFQQWRMRARDVPLRRCGGIDWLVADMNIDPKSTMAALGRIAMAPGVQLAGIVATLKLPDWSRAAEVSGWIKEFFSWGLEPRARQLSTGGREICVVAVRPEGAWRPVVRKDARGGRIRRRRATRRPDQ